MEIPAVALLYALLIVLTAGALLYIFMVFDNAVYDINRAACDEVATLITLALQRLETEIYNYTGYIELYYPAVFTYIDNRLIITVGHDTRRPAQCELALPQYIVAHNGTGTRVIIHKQITGYGECADKLPALGKKNGKLIVVEKCEKGLEIANYVTKLYIQ